MLHAVSHNRVKHALANANRVIVACGHHILPLHITPDNSFDHSRKVSTSVHTFCRQVDSAGQLLASLLIGTARVLPIDAGRNDVPHQSHELARWTDDVERYPRS